MDPKPTFARLSHRDYDACSSVVHRLYEEVPLPQFPDRLLPLLTELVPVEHVSYNDFNVRERRYIVHTHPKRQEMDGLLPLFATCFPTHPLIKEYERGEASPTKISDVVTARQFRETPFYQEIYRKLGTKHQMIFFMHSNQTRRIGLAFNRAQRDFSERDRSVLAFLSPHITRAYKNARIAAGLSSSLEQIGEGLGVMRRAIILADAEGRVSWASDLAQEWLKEFFDDCTESSETLPDSLKNWLTQKRHAAPFLGPKLAEMQTGTVAGFRLLIYCGRTGDDSVVIALLREREVMDPATMAAMGLTERESQILFWISEAKTNPQIAAILGISPRTIHKHTEHLFAKLGLENRMAALRLGLELRRV